MTAPLPDDEAARIEALYDHRILDTVPEEDLDNLVRLVAHVCGVPIAAVSLIDQHRQWFKAITGLAVTETPREVAFCSHTILQPDLMVVPDTLADPRFSDNPLVTGDPHIRFYAGATLFTAEGHALGSLCVIDRVPRQLTPEQENVLRLLARQAASQIAASRRVVFMECLLEEQARVVAERDKADAERRQYDEALRTEREFQRVLLESLQEGIVACDAEGTLTLFNRATQEFHGLPEKPLPPDWWAEHFDLYQADGQTPMVMQDIPLFRALQGERVQDAEMVIAPKTGRARVLLASGQALYDASGKKLGAVVAMHDVTEQKRIERELSRLAAIVESSGEAIFAATLDGTIVSWNKGAERLYGYAVSEMVGRHVSCLFREDEQNPVPAVVTRLLRGEITESQEVARTRRDGTGFHAALSFSPIHDLAGQMIGISCIARDITDRKKAEAALAESETRLRRLSDAAFEGIVVSQDGVMIDANAAFAAGFGYDDPAQMRGIPAIALIAPESTALVLQKIATRDEEPYEAVLQRRDGTTFQAEIRARTTQFGGRPARVTAVRDVTHQKALERELREREERLRAVLESAPIILYAVDADGLVTLSEGTGLAVLGLRPGEAVGRSVFEFSGGDAEMDANTRRALAGESLSYDTNVQGLWLHTVLSPVKGADGAPAGFIGVCIDITERVASEERFRVLFEASSDPHLLLGEGGTIDCNDATIAMLGCRDKSEVLSLHPAVMSPEFQPDGRLSREKRAVMDALAYKRGFNRFEWVLRKVDGQEFPVEVTLTPVTLAGRPVLLSVLHDLTERKRHEEQIQDHAIALEFQKGELEKVNAELESLATTDGLTGLKNHRAFQERLSEEASRAARYGTPLSVVFLDVDKFKQYNDAYGHPAGDAVLKTVSRLLLEIARDTDIIARYGGEEFVLVLPQTDLSGAMRIAERLRAGIQRHPWPVRAITASFGVAALGLPGESARDMIVRADAALYRAKAAGRNQVCGDQGSETIYHARENTDAWSDHAGIASSSEAVFISDLNGVFLQINARACELLGFAESDLIGTNGLDLIHPDDLTVQGWRMDDVVAGLAVVTERRVRRRDGSWLWAELRTQRLADGRAECVMREAVEGGTTSLGGNRLLREAGDGFSMLDALVAAVDNKDRYTRRHSEDVMAHALLIARELGLDTAEQDTIAVAALLHDVGKIGVPDAVLRKPGALTAKEFEAVKRHPQMGAAIVSVVPGLEGTLAAVRHHHERWDGRGYPFGLRGTEIPFLARLMAVADAFSAMIMDRPYRQGMSTHEALTILEAGAGNQWDAECVSALLRAMRREIMREAA